MDKIIGLLIKKKRLEMNMSQETLCQGICVISYLSKIERGTVDANHEIITELCKALGIQYYGDIEKIFIEEFYDSLERALIWNNGLETLKELKNKYSYMKYSKEALAYIMGDFICKIEDIKTVDINEFKEYEIYCDMNQLYYLYICLGYMHILKNKDYNSSYEYFKKAHMIRPDKKGWYFLGFSCYLDGNYHMAIDYFQKDLNLEFDQGDIDGVVNSCIYLANSYSNLGSIPLMMRYYNQALKLNKYLNKEIEYSIYYNIGASYINIDGEKAIDYLKKAEEIKADKDDFVLYQKLILGYIKNENFCEAKKYYEKASKCSEENLEAEEDKVYRKDSLRMLQIIIEDENYLTNEEYGKILYRLYNKGKDMVHYGVKLFFGKYYIKWLKANRRYKEALEVSESLTFPISNKK